MENQNIERIKTTTYQELKNFAENLKIMEKRTVYI